MSAPYSANVYTQGFGSKPELGQIIAQVNPGNIWSPSWHIGLQWINTASNTVYTLTSLSTSSGVTTPTWTLLESASGALNTLTGGTGGAISPSANNITLAGTANQITTTGSGSTITFSVPSSPSFGGTVTAASGFTATAGNLTLSGAASKVLVNATTAATASIGTSAAMSAGTVTVSTTAVTAASKIFLTVNTPGGTQGTLSAPTGSITAGTSFVINSSSSSDTSTVNYWIVN